VGQKVHPLGFRLNTTQKHKSIWFTQLNKYSSLLEQDEIIRTYIKTNYDSAGIANIEIERTYKVNNIFLKIYVAKPGVIITESGSGLINLTKKLKALLPRSIKLVLTFLK
jgi:small subunit ribosomal protein S3